MEDAAHVRADGGRNQRRWSSRFVGAAEGRFGRTDICVTNAGGPPSKTLLEISAEGRRTGEKAALGSGASRVEDTDASAIAAARTFRRQPAGVQRCDSVLGLSRCVFLRDPDGR